MTLLSLRLHYEQDIVLARQRTRQVAALLGFDAQDQTRLATAASEIARNAFTYAQEAMVEFRLEGTTLPQVFAIQVSDRGPGIADVDAILDGRYRSTTGMGVGMIGAKRLMDRFDVVSRIGEGTDVTLRKFIPAKAGLVTPAHLTRLSAELARQSTDDPLEEVQRQNQELLRTLAELNKRQEELSTLNRELEDTNRGVVALYAELDEKADHLRRADELKSRFLSNMSHEFRTPVNSIQALARMLLERTDGDLSAEQERQVHFIRKAADALAELVSDLLDLAKVEAGKIVVNPTEFDLEHIFGTLRGMLKPLLVNESVALVFDEAEGIPALHTDEAKVSQILRNFISNALKFTEHGEVRVSARLLANDTVAFAVADTGIGIAPEDQERIFQEFAQIDSPIQRRVQGTGLGLPLCRKLAELLGGSVHVESTPGVGSTFTAMIPRIYQSAIPETPGWEIDASRFQVLAIEDNPQDLFLYQKMLDSSGFQMLPARNLREARGALAAFRPHAILLDIMLAGEDAWTFLAEVKQHAATREIPLVIVSTVEDQAKAFALGADAYCVKPVDRYGLLQTLTRLVDPGSLKRVLVVDDEDISRYVLRQHLLTPRHLVSEASSGAEALRLAASETPDVICLDLTMPDLDGFEVLRRLKLDPATQDIPVVVVTARVLAERDKHALLERAACVLSKDLMSRETTVSAVDAALQQGGKR